MIARITEKATKRTLIILFVFVGLGLMGARWIFLGTDRIYPEEIAWKISIAGQFDVTRDMTVITGLKPRTRKQNKLISQSFYHPGMKILTSNQPTPGRFQAKARLTGKTEFIAEYFIQHRKSPVAAPGKQPELTPELRELYLLSDNTIDLSLPDLIKLNNDLRKDTHNVPELTHKIYLTCKSLIKDNQPTFNEIASILKHNKATTLGRARLMIALSRLNNIPARLVTGFILKEKTINRPDYWVELYDEDQGWRRYDPEKGYEATLPTNYVAFGYDSPDIFTVEYGKKLSEEFVLAEDNEILDLERFKQDQSLLEVFNLRRLDIENRQVLTLLLLLPFCVLLTAFLRHVLGLDPYGTFTAPLLALAMVYAEMVVTLVVASIVIFLALIGRSILPKSLPRSPRLSLIFTFVALAMVFSTSIMDYFSIDQGGKIILLPTIILVAVVDRFYSYMDDTSTHAALIRLAVTIGIALLCIPVLENQVLGTFILTYPEFHLITASLVLMFSSYKGKKLTDQPYLSVLGVKPGRKKKQDKKSGSETPENKAGQ